MESHSDNSDWFLGIFLRDTDAYYSVYLICAAAAMACVLKNECTPLCDSRKKTLVLLIFALWFASTTVLANYRLFIVKPFLERILSAVAAFLGGTAAGYNIIWCAAAGIPFSRQQREGKERPERSLLPWRD